MYMKYAYFYASLTNCCSLELGFTVAPIFGNICLVFLLPSLCHKVFSDVYYFSYHITENYVFNSFV